MQPLLARYPLGFAQWLIALDYAVSHPREVAIVGGPDADDTRALLDVMAGYRPHQVIALGKEGTVPLLRGRSEVDGRATAYVCVDFACRPPINDPSELQTLIER